MGMDKTNLKTFNCENFNIYIYKILKQIHPTLGISRKAMQVLNSFVLDTLENIGGECGKLIKYGKRQTLTGREIQSACKLIFPGELANHATSEGSKALQKYGTG